MTYEDVKEKLDELYGIAIEQKDVGMALGILQEMIAAAAVEAERKER